MNRQTVFCPNKACHDKHKVGKGNIVSHGKGRQRCKCKSCGHTFSYRRGTMFYGLRSDEQMGISHNHLLGQFKRMVGISPKALARLYRLKFALHSINPMQPVDWALLANLSHYYDQSHFNNDFKTFSGHTPTDYLRLRRQAYTTNPERDQLLHVLSIE